MYRVVHQGIVDRPPGELVAVVVYDAAERVVAFRDGAARDCIKGAGQEIRDHGRRSSRTANHSPKSHLLLKSIAAFCHRGWRLQVICGREARWWKSASIAAQAVSKHIQDNFFRRVVDQEPPIFIYHLWGTEKWQPTV